VKTTAVFDIAMNVFQSSDMPKNIVPQASLQKEKELHANEQLQIMKNG